MKTQNLQIDLLEEREVQSNIRLFAENVYAGDQKQAEEHFDADLNGPSSTFMAKLENEFAGFITIRWEPHNEDFRQNNIPFIQHLEVKPEFQGQGIATHLMDAAEALIKTKATHAGTCVGIFGNYGPAQRLYAKRGYIPDGRGLCQWHRPVQEGESVIIDHDLVLWLVKKL
ncbi:MAG: GNAT family N-acetyltransferase [Chloroflexota bacterium]